MNNEPIENPVLLTLLKAHAEQQAHAPAIRYHGRKTLSYSAMLLCLHKIHGQFTGVGLHKSSRIAIVMPDGPETALIILASMTFAVCAPLNPRFTRREFAYYFKDLGIQQLILPTGADSPAKEAADELGIQVLELAVRDSGQIGSIELRCKEKTLEQFDAGFKRLNARDVSLLLHTSGTTSRPKIVALTQGNICSSCYNIVKSLSLSEHDSCLNIMPLFHIHGIMAGLLAPLVSGGSVICSPGFAQNPFFVMQFFPWLGKTRPSWYTAVPTMHQAIVAQAPQHTDILRSISLRFIRSSSASLAPQLMQEIESLFDAPVIEAYGMTEAAHQMAANPLPPALRKPGSVGLAAGPQICIMDESGEKLGQGQKGEIVIRGDNVMRAYEHNTEANRNAFFGDWFRTGDEGYFDADGYLFISGRLKELINRGGEKISPREIDEVLLAHEAVQQAVTFAAPHPSLGEVPAAAIILKRNYEHVSEKTLQDFVRQRLAVFKVPDPIVLVDKIPKGPTGKLQRIGLAEKLLTQYA